MNYLRKRAIQSLITIFLILIVNFILFRVIPGNPVRILIRGPGMTQEIIEKYMALFGLDQPLHVQFYKYFVETFRGNLGISFSYQEPVLELLLERMYNTLILLVPATLISIAFGMFLGIIGGWKRGSNTDYYLQIFSLGFWSIPTFWLGMIFIMLFGGAFAVGGMLTPGMTYSNFLSYLGDLLNHMFLPALTLALIMHGQYFMIMRSQLIEELTESYTQTAKAKGLTPRSILQRHAVPNAMLPMTTLIAVNIAILIAGFITIETVFSWPGLGTLIYKAILQRDYPILQGVLLFLAVAVVLANFVADVIYSQIDPRIKHE